MYELLLPMYAAFIEGSKCYVKEDVLTNKWNTLTGIVSKVIPIIRRCMSTSVDAAQVFNLQGSLILALGGAIVEVELQHSVQ